MSAAAIVGAGMVTGVGFSAPASCAAIRGGITGFVETGFMFDGDWLIGSPVPFDEGWYGREKLLRMAALALDECLTQLDGIATREVPLLLCLAEETRAGRLDGLDATFFDALEQRSGARFHDDSALGANGRVAGVRALDRARELIAKGAPACLVLGVDSLLVARTLEHYHAKRRLLTANNSDGFIPGEAAACVILAPARGADELLVAGIGYGTEPATIDSEEPLRATGLVEVIRGAIAQAGISLGQLDYRIADVSGPQYSFKEAALALTRVLRERKQGFDLWHPADCIGETGAAAAPLTCGVALAAARKRYAPGPGVLCHFANDDPQRAGVALRYVDGAAR